MNTSPTSMWPACKIPFDLGRLQNNFCATFLRLFATHFTVSLLGECCVGQWGGWVWNPRRFFSCHTVNVHPKHTKKFFWKLTCFWYLNIFQYAKVEWCYLHFTGVQENVLQSKTSKRMCRKKGYNNNVCK